MTPERFVVKNIPEAITLFSRMGQTIDRPYPKPVELNTEVWAVDPPRCALVHSIQDAENFFELNHSGAARWMAKPQP